MAVLNQVNQLQQLNHFHHTTLPSCPGIPYRLHGVSTTRVEVMTPPANRLIDVLKSSYPTFEQTHPLQDHVRQAMHMLSWCHTSALGGHIERCPHGHIERIFYNSCGHRFCPRCAGRIRRKWLLERQAKLLPVRHYHVVFTVPHAFNALWRRNPQRMGDLLFHIATDTLRALLREPRWLGAEPGITVTLETWDDRLFFHPHLHCLITGGGLSAEGEWKDTPNPKCLVAVKPLMWEFRKRFCQGLKQALQEDTLDLPEGTTMRQWLNRVNKVNRQKWEVFIAKPPEDGGPTPQEILRYQAEDVAGGPLSGDRLVAALSALSERQLAYLKSAPLSASRLEEALEGEVRFRWGSYDPASGRRERSQIESLSIETFLQRYLPHVPPPHYQTVRHYGLYSSAKKFSYECCLDLLADRQPSSLSGVDSTDSGVDTEAWIEEHTCPVCGQALIVSGYLPSSLNGEVIPRMPLGHVFTPSTTSGGAHAP